MDFKVVSSFSIINENVCAYINVKIYLQDKFREVELPSQKVCAFSINICYKLPSPTVVPVQPSYQQQRKAPFFDTLGIFKFFIFSNLIREKNISHCLIHSSSFKEEANCSKTNSSHEPVFKKICGMSRASSVSTYFALAIHSTVKLEKWAMSRKICDTQETWMNGKILVMVILRWWEMRYHKVYVQ